MSKKWTEKYVGNYTIYWGRFSRPDYRLGLTVGNYEGSIDLIIGTVGYMKTKGVKYYD